MSLRLGALELSTLSTGRFLFHLPQSLFEQIEHRPVTA